MHHFTNDISMIIKSGHIHDTMVRHCIYVHIALAQDNKDHWLNWHVKNLYFQVIKQSAPSLMYILESRNGRVFTNEHLHENFWR